MSLEESAMPDNDEQIQIVANNLLQIYCDSTNEEGNTSLLGLTHMENIMSSVMYDYRALVFSSFLTLLQMNGIEYDHKVFQGNASKVIH